MGINALVNALGNNVVVNSTVVNNALVYAVINNAVVSIFAGQNGFSVCRKGKKR